MIKRLEDQTSQELTRIMKHLMLKRPTGVDQPEATEEEAEEVTTMESSEDVGSTEDEVPLEVNSEAILELEVEDVVSIEAEVDIPTLEKNHNTNLKMRRSVMDQSHSPKMRSLLLTKELRRTKISLRESSR
mgnify:CR=1 FL=1